MIELLDFLSPIATDVTVTGGKGASLARMAQANLPIPYGCILPIDAYRWALENANVAESIADIDRAIHEDEIVAAVKLGETVRRRIQHLSIPSTVLERILSKFTKSEALIVRSSASVEDSSSAAWAGQFESVLGVRLEPRALEQAIKTCWASAFSERALHYRQLKAREVPVEMAVVVQKLVNAEIAGVAFSQNILNGDTSELLIEAVLGLGQPLVSGEVTPECLIIDKSSGNIKERKTPAQHRRLVTNDRGTTWEELAPKDIESPKLSAALTQELASLVAATESLLAAPCDVEWAIAQNFIWLVQARPITARSTPLAPSAKYLKLFSRDFCLPSVEAWVRGECTNPKGWTEQVQPFLPYIVTARSDDTVHFYYDLNGVEWIQSLLIKLAETRPEFLLELEADVARRLEYLQPIYESEQVLDLPGLQHFLQQLEAAYPSLEAMWWYCQTDYERIKHLNLERIQQIRTRTDALCNGSDSVIRRSLKQLFPHFGEDAVCLSTREILTGALPTPEELRKRDRGYFFTNDTLILGTSTQLVREAFNIQLEEEAVEFDGTMLQGDRAQGGIVRGRVRRVMGHRQIPLLEEGEVLVAPMTLPDFLPAIRKASAIVTDEGGTVCHAAIVARELGSPALLGQRARREFFKTETLWKLMLTMATCGASLNNEQKYQPDYASAPGRNERRVISNSW